MLLKRGFDRASKSGNFVKLIKIQIWLTQARSSRQRAHGNEGLQVTSLLLADLSVIIIVCRYFHVISNMRQTTVLSGAR